MEFESGCIAMEVETFLPWIEASGLLGFEKVIDFSIKNK
jgi:hypothetical protein